MKLSIPSSFLAAAILADSATARRQRRSNRNSANAAKQRPPRPRSLVEAAAEGIGMPNSMSFDMMGVGGAYIKGNSGSGKSRKEPKKYDVEAEVDIEYTTGCGYLLTFSFKHDENLPVPNQTAIQCDTATPVIYEYDELSYTDSRQFEIPFSDKIYEETGFASQGIDFNPCGHPPVNVFNVPHYDMHFYTSPLEIREGWTCVPFAPAPAICDFTSVQASASGRAFFNVDTIWTGVYSNTEAATYQPANMPTNFTCDMSAAIPVMGTHCHNYATQPSTAENWTEPVLIMGSYDGNIAFVESMAPLSFVTGPTDNDFEEDVVYAGQTIESLPSSYDVKYDATTGRTTVTLAGQRRFCDV